MTAGVEGLVMDTGGKWRRATAIAVVGAILVTLTVPAAVDRAAAGDAAYDQRAETDEADERVRIATSGGLDDRWTNRRYAPEDVWAYQRRQKPDVPQTGGSASGHPVDAFIQRRLEEAGIEPAGRADRRTLIRRLTFGLTGLPPTSRQVQAFVEDESPDAYERLVDRLLATPQYGEQWARQWLDVVRYADTAGGSNDFERPTAWRYRDYVIRSFNADKPFDRFVIEQIAGDELDAGDPEMLVATGFLRMGPWEHTGMSVAAHTRQAFLDDMTNSVGVTFLGQALNCASCHDHKTDPVPTRDYYRFQAIFAPVQQADRDAAFVPGEKPTVTGPAVEASRARLDAVVEETRRQRHHYNRQIERAQRDWLRDHGYDPDEVDLRDLPDDERPTQGNLRFFGLDEDEKGVVPLLHRRDQFFQRRLRRYEPRALSVYNGPTRVYRSPRAPHGVPGDRSGETDEVRILLGGPMGTPDEKVRPGVLSAAPNAGDHPIPQTRDGRRLALARWIVDPENPLTARVIANRVWQRHFGRGLVATPNDFGAMGERPSHPELLDYLANYLIEHGWSIKALDRHILTSETYRRHHEHPDVDAVRKRDPDNALLAHFSPRRLTAEEVRDAMLAASGELNLQQGGPGVFPEIDRSVAFQPRHLMGTIGPVYQPSPTPAQRHRRSIYTFRHRGLENPFLEVFDRPSSDISCPERDETTVTPQVFGLFNSQHAHDRALAMAARAKQAAAEEDLAAQVSAAFVLAFQRPPGKTELTAAIEHVRQLTERHRQQQPEPAEPPTSVTHRHNEERTGEPFEWEEPLDIYAEHFEPDLKPWDVSAETRALAELCLVLLNANEFLYLY